MTDSHSKTASERAAAKAAGVDDLHPGDRPDDEVSPKPEPPVVESKPLAAKEGKPAQHRHVGGSSSDKFNLKLVRQTMDAFWITDREELDKAASCAVIALAGIAPKDELEGMLASQLVAAHQASLECYRRGMLTEQTIEARGMNLKMATKASATFAALLDTLNRHRGKGGEQRCVVEHRHVHLHEGSPLSVDHPGGGVGHKNGDRPHEQRAIGHASQPTLRIEDASGDLVPQPSDAERKMPATRRRKPRRSER